MVGGFALWLSSGGHPTTWAGPFRTTGRKFQFVSSGSPAARGSSLIWTLPGLMLPSSGTATAAAAAHRRHRLDGCCPLQAAACLPLQLACYFLPILGPYILPECACCRRWLYGTQCCPPGPPPGGLLPGPRSSCSLRTCKLKAVLLRCLHKQSVSLPTER